MVDKKILWVAASLASIGMLLLAWKSGLGQEVIWMGAFIACIALPGWAMLLDDDNAES
tara:strand:- start:1497 stop:1670 length:174 start_codon:yes stop_codon:yes gene_type:complete